MVDEIKVMNQVSEMIIEIRELRNKVTKLTQDKLGLERVIRTMEEEAKQ